MSIERVKYILRQGEGVRVEYKKSHSKLPKDLFESICSLLNHDGGDIVLGTDDSGHIEGIAPEEIKNITANLVNLSNNPQKLDPPFILFPSVYEIQGNTVIHIQVPSSSQLHRTSGDVFDRSNDGDYRVTEPHLIAEIYNRKRAQYSEGIIYEYISMDDFNGKLFPKVRNLIKSNEANHPWLALNDEQLLQKAGLYKRDFQTGKEGYTLAAVLLFGKNDVIQQVLPHYKIDALLRKENLDRYDDRLYIQTNLIDAYDELMGFVAKHLPDKYYVKNEQRKSLRTSIFREIVANIIVHREYTNAHPSTFIIYRDRVETENANTPNPHSNGILSVENFSPYPKNPTLAKFFIQLGRVEELGSGVLNVHKFIEEYSGSSNAQFIEGQVFKMYIPVTMDATVQATIHATTQATVQAEKESKILQFCLEPKNRDEIQDHLDIKNRSYFRKNILKPLIEKGLLQLTIPDRPTSPMQKYYSEEKGQILNHTPVTTQATIQATAQATTQATIQAEKESKILQFCIEPKNRDEIQGHLDIENRSYFRKNRLKPLIEKGLLLLTIPDKPTSPMQKYYSEEKGQILNHTPVTTQATIQATTQATTQATIQAEKESKILQFCLEPKNRDEIQGHLDIKNRSYFRKNILNPLIKKGLLKLTIPDKPTSPNQKYYADKKRIEK